MCDLFGIEDLSTFGLGLDIAGAFLLTRGLLASPSQIALNSMTFFGYTHGIVTRLAEDKVAGQFGLVALIAGFLLQAVGYALMLSAGPSAEAGWQRVVVAIAFAAAAVVIVLSAHAKCKPRLVRQTLLAVAHVNAYARPVTVEPRPYGGLLLHYGTELGHPARKVSPKRRMPGASGM